MIQPTDVKSETVRQWSAEPAGAHLAGGHERGTPEFFAAVERSRYELYPWLLLEFLQDRERWAERDVLEIGVGLGTDHLQLSRAGGRMTGIDLTPVSIEQTHVRLCLAGTASRLAVADAEALPFADKSYDAVYSFGVLHHTPRIDLAIAEIHRVLRPGGRALIALYNRDSYFHLWRLTRYFLRGDWRKKTLADMRSEFEFGSGRPLVMVLSRRKVQTLFREFASVEIEGRHLPLHRLPFAVPSFAKGIVRGAERRWGGYWMVDAVR